jgi:2-polyprenyl-3-methyl-5-hydroxy-6-metoxy-1,4-benzoquinol methylase
MSAGELGQEDIAFQSNLYESGNPTRRWLHNARREWVLDMIKLCAPTNALFLEVGCGCGIYTAHMAALGKVRALDINPEFVAAASSIPNVDASITDIQAFDSAPIYDIAVCSEVIEHIPDSALALANIYRALKPGGRLILTTPHAFSTMEIFARLLAFPPVVALARLVYGEAVADLGHINRLTRARLRAQIDAAGFNVVHNTSRALYLPVLAEFGGIFGLRLAQHIEARLRGNPLLSQVLWTQCWLLEKPSSQE